MAVGCLYCYFFPALTRLQFHSDAEVGLGPLVAGLSLGSPALMHFRIVARHDPLYERRGVLLTVVLRHVSLHFSTFIHSEILYQGDILVMDGHGVQEYYE
jgi:alkylated DNA repair dioxygenase AlkB